MKEKLKSKDIKDAITKGRPGYHGDGGGLWFVISKTGGHSWSFRYMLNGKSREMGLGPIDTVTLAEAREKARDARRLLLDKIDPIENRKRQHAVTVTTCKTFEEVMEAYLEKRSGKGEWKSDRHPKQWRSSLVQHVLPKIGKMPVDQIGIHQITSVLEPMFRNIPVTASRVRGRIESVLAYATVMHWRSGDNPARWRGNLETIFGKSSHDVEHHEAMQVGAVPEFVAKLADRSTPASEALSFLILTAARTEEVRMMTWEEVDLDQGLWTVPADRMKAGKEHTVPLSTQAVALLRSIPKANPEARLFNIGSTAMWQEGRKVLGEETEVTVHGFRSSFRDWAGDHTEFERETIEHALAHQLKDKAEAAYRRSSALNKRRLLMQAWADYCFGVEQQSNVTQLRRQG
jgi:integrase